MTLRTPHNSFDEKALPLHLLPLLRNFCIDTILCVAIPPLVEAMCHSACSPSPVKASTTSVHNALHGTAVQHWRVAICTVQAVLQTIALQQIDLQFVHCKLYYDILQCCKSIGNVHGASCNTKYCTAALVMCNLYRHTCCSTALCDMKFTV